MLGVFAYANSLEGEFIWDDVGLVENNADIKSFTGLPRIFSTNIWAGIGENSTAYRPLQMATYFIDYSLWRLNPWGYHLTNVLLHILAALALYWLITLLFKQRLLALFSALIFICHPVQTEAVAYISGRADLLAAIFIFLSFGFYLKLLGQAQRSSWVLMVLTFILAILARENALILPLLLLLYHLAFRRPVQIRKLAPFLIIAGIYLLIRISLMSTVFYDLPVNSTWIQRLPGSFAALTNYLRILFFPVGLHMEYGPGLFKFFALPVVLGYGLFLFLLAGIFKSRNHSPQVFFGLSWFLICLLPASNLFPLNAYMAEHWLYLPGVGLFIILGGFFANLFKRKESHPAAVGLLICLLLAYTGLTIKQNLYWRSAITFFERTLKYSPQSARAYYHLGNLYCRKGEKERGVRMYFKAIQLYPRYPEAYNNIGNEYIEAGSNEEGISFCQLALKFNPSLPEVYYNLGNAYYNLGQTDKSISMLKECIRLNPRYLAAYNNLAASYAAIGDLDQAIRLWHKAIEIDPGFTIAHFNLANFYFLRKEYPLAIKHCDRVLALGAQVDAKFLKMLEPYRNNK